MFSTTEKKTTTSNSFPTGNEACRVRSTLSERNPFWRKIFTVDFCCVPGSLLRSCEFGAASIETHVRSREAGEEPVIIACDMNKPKLTRYEATCGGGKVTATRLSNCSICSLETTIPPMPLSSSIGTKVCTIRCSQVDRFNALDDPAAAFKVRTCIAQREGSFPLPLSSRNDEDTLCAGTLLGCACPSLPSEKRALSARCEALWRSAARCRHVIAIFNLHGKSRNDVHLPSQRCRPLLVAMKWKVAAFIDEAKGCVCTRLTTIDATAATWLS